MKKRRSQEERSAETVANLREATISLIAERGYANVTTTEISHRAGVSRGALTHHFPYKVDLIVDAAAHVWRQAVEQVRELSDDLAQGEVDIDAFVDGMWARVFRRPAVIMTLDLISAARADEVLEARIAGPLHELFEAYDEIADQAFAGFDLSGEQRRVLVSLTTCTIRGLRLQDLMHPDAAMVLAICDALKMMLRSVLDQGAALPAHAGVSSGRGMKNSRSRIAARRAAEVSAHAAPRYASKAEML